MSDNLTFWSEEHLASLSVLPDFAEALKTLAEISCSPLVPLQAGIGPAGWFGRTSPASCRATEEGTLDPSSGCWANSGMGSPTGFLTLSSSEWPKDAAVCSLSDVLETGDVPLRFFLSATACKGILRRAEKRGKQLPPALMCALEEVAKRHFTQAEG